MTQRATDFRIVTNIPRRLLPVTGQLMCFHDARFRPLPAGGEWQESGSVVS